MTWLRTYRAYLENHCYKEEEIQAAIAHLEELLSNQPVKFRETLEKFLDTWSRDDFVNVSGLCATIYALAEPLQKIVKMHEVFTIERQLSHALQPELTNLQRIQEIRTVRDDVRKLLRKAGYRGLF